ncbi:kinase-like domain-containing protein [Rhizophagus clarus]|uniref:Kinase-like domain-containing protein n=1 Tax=Rhizophagus clarus TaxID=94130 RepID=A0A8H3KP00_9GLOM|nr:kinase-like domain-containing protein [Rhizophagus clarus]
MSQLNDERLKCVQCKQLKQTNIKIKYCEACILKNCEKKYGRCIECKQIYTGKDWCQTCNSKRFQQNFENWTSGNDDIDKFIQKGGFGKVYKANWKDGYITHWDSSKHQWKRIFKVNSFVALKSLSNSQNVKLKFINEITLHLKIHEYKISDQIIKCHGITQDPETKDYIMVMNYAIIGSLWNVLNKKKKKLYKKHIFSDLNCCLQIWKCKINILHQIAVGLKRIHGKELIHRDLHIGNIVCFRYSYCITDMGLCKPANYNELENAENNVYGVLAYLAPEILRGEHYTQASDIYSFGVIMYEVISELPPYYDTAHELCLALDICEGLRPEFNIKVPQLVLHLIKRCLDANPSDRPNAKELLRTIYEWVNELNKYCIRMEDDELIKTELIKQIEETDKINNALANNNSSLTYKMHPKAVYKSRPLYFKSLPEPKNSNDYYEIYNNISTKRYSENFPKFDKSDCFECEIVD